MPITMNSFRCSNGHEFEANAKLRTRCPECGVMTKRSFGSAIKQEPKPEPVVETPKPEPVAETPKPEPVVTKPDDKKPVLIRRGRERMTTKAAPAKKEKPLPPKRTLIGSKVAGGLVKTKTVTTRGAVATIKGRPKKTAVARGTVAGHEERKPFWHSVVDKYGL